MKVISVVIPCLNESINISKCIEKAFNAFSIMGIEGEVIVVDNNSTDDSYKVAQKAGAKVVRCSEPGYGNAVRYGFSVAEGKYIIFGDGDNTYDFNEIHDFTEQ